MRSLAREIRFFGRLPAAVAAVIILCLLSSIAVAFGMAEVARERASITRVLQLQAGEEQALIGYAEDVGTFAYSDFRVTWNAPSGLAFAALGQRDTAPSILRVRPLALEAQIYENEQTNPELALPGRFDLAFVAIYLAPLVLIVLLHDLWSGEREAGRLGALRALPKATSRIFLPRVLVRAGLVGAALLIPFAVGATFEGAPPGRAWLFAGAMAGVVVFWTLLVVLVAQFGGRSTVNAAALAGLWFALTLVGPATASLVVNAAVPTPEGARLMRENRDAVHGSWDLPRQATLDRFFAVYPEWSDTEPMTAPFHWKWYFASQHLGDVAVAEMSEAYRDGVERREALAGTAGWLMPPVGFQRIMHRAAETDVVAQLAYQERVRDFHTRLRTFYYPYLFEDRAFGAADYAAGPRFDDASPPASAPGSGLSGPLL